MPFLRTTNLSYNLIERFACLGIKYIRLNVDVNGLIQIRCLFQILIRDRSFGKELVKP